VQLLKYVFFIIAIVGQLAGIVLLLIDKQKALGFFIVYGIGLILLLAVLIIERRKEKKEDDERDYRDY
jgi:phosphate starvation-inducible membrane PsiE